MPQRATRTSPFRPVQILVGSFVAMILIGTGLLMLPECRAEGESIRVLDALFTSTSAVCVTGLAVVDTATVWTRAGQLIILLLLQLGGIGIITFGALFALLLGQKISFRQRALLKEQYGQTTAVNIVQIIPVIAGTTLVIELLGALCLLPVFVPKFGTAEGVWHSIFQAVSAFCNCGLSTFSDSLEPYVGDWWLNLVICGLIVLGGLGFPVIAELLEHRGRRRRYSLHTRVVLWTSGILIVAGALLFFIIESWYDPSFLELPFRARVLASFFQSVTARTAGFNTVRIGAIAPASVLLLQVLMFIGGSPSGTAGGIKTTTFAASLAAVKSVFTGQADTRLLDRRLARDTVKRALVLAMLAAMVVGLGHFLMLMAADPAAGSGLTSCRFLELGFETMSAFGTVGLSTGITPELTSGQKIVIILMMLIGRLGPMTFALAFARPRREQIRFPETDLLTG